MKRGKLPFLKEVANEGKPTLSRQKSALGVPLIKNAITHILEKYIYKL